MEGWPPSRSGERALLVPATDAGRPGQEEGATLLFYWANRSRRRLSPPQGASDFGRPQNPPPPATK